MLYLLQKSRWCLYVGLQVSFILLNYCCIPDCLSEMSVSRSSRACQVMSHLMSVCFKVSKSVELYWLSVALFHCILCIIWIGVHMQARVASLKFLVCCTLPRQDWDWMISGSCTVTCAFLQMTRALDSSSLYVFLQWPRLCKAGRAFSWWHQPAPSTQNHNLWLHPSTVTVGSLQSVWYTLWALNLIQKLPGKIVGWWLISYLSFNMEFEIHWSCQLWKKPEFCGEVSEEFIGGNCGLRWNIRLLHLPFYKCILRDLYLWITNITLGETKGRDLHCIAI